MQATISTGNCRRSSSRRQNQGSPDDHHTIPWRVSGWNGDGVRVNWWIMDVGGQGGMVHQLM
eukprot:1276630-Karenia_brevis.AAC.1